MSEKSNDKGNYIIANIVTDKEGNPIDGNGNKLSASSYNPPEEIKKLFAQCQTDYQKAYTLQHRSFDEFDGISLLNRTRLDQQTFGAYVGAVYEPASKAWRWKGRKNTARNKIIGILAHVLAGMLYPYCYAYNEENEEDETTARVMRILIENHLKKANYEIKFLYMITSALVLPAVHVEVEYVEAMSRIKEKKDGKWHVSEAVDIFLSGLGLNIIPIDQILPADFFTNEIQRQPYMIRVRRIPYDEARSIYAGKYFDDGKDRFDYVEAGKTRIWMTGQEHQTLYDIEWTEADRSFVQEITVQYRPEDLELCWVGGVGMFNYDDPYNSNPFKHRRMSLIGDEWKTIPVYPYAKTGFEPLDPTGRFYYYKSAAFKEFWDDASVNRAYQLAQDGMFLDVIKPMFISGVSKVDQTVIVPGATIAMPQGADAKPYQLGPNLAAAMQILSINKDDLSESTQSNLQNGVSQPGVTATAALKAEQNAQIMIGQFSIMIADLIRQIGELTIDCIIQHETVGELDATLPGSLNMKYRMQIAKTKENGQEITNKIQFDSSMVGQELSKNQANEMEWDMYEKNGKNTVSYRVNPYKFARTQFSLFIDPSQITSRSMGTDMIRKDRAFQMLMDPRVAPFVNQKAVVDKYVIEEYADGDPDQFKAEQPSQDMLNQVMGAPQGPVPQPSQIPGVPGVPRGV